MKINYEEVLNKYLGPNKEFLETNFQEKSYSLNGMRITGDVVCIKYDLANGIAGDNLVNIAKLTDKYVARIENGLGVLQEIDIGMFLIRYFNKIELDHCEYLLSCFKEIFTDEKDKISISINFGEYVLCNFGSQQRFNMRIFGSIIRITMVMADIGMKENKPLLISESIKVNNGSFITATEYSRIGIVGSSNMKMFEVVVS